MKKILPGLIAAIFLVSSLVTFYLSWIGMQKADVVIRWQTASEMEVTGYFIGRSTNADGPFERIDAEIIPATGDALAGGEYSFTDTTALPGIVYYYSLEEVLMNGHSVLHEPIEVRSEPKGKTERILGCIFLTGGLFMAAYGLWEKKRAH